MSSFWAERIIEQARAHDRNKKRIIVRDEKTASGRVHVGSLRGVVLHGAVSDELARDGVPHTFLYEINDFDPMDGLPTSLDQDTYRPYLGFPLCAVPSPDGRAKNYAEYFGGEFIGVIRELGYTPEFYRSSDAYRAGKYDAVIKTALEHAEAIREIYRRVSGSEKEEHWLPLNVVCEKCGKVSTTRATAFDGELVTYSCGDFVDWTRGCGHSGKVSPFHGNAKLPWKVEWAAKFTVFDVAIEGGGKDHSTKGGSRDIADHISREVFKREPPQNIPYEFFHIKGKKMSSSKGAGMSAREIADLLPPHLLRFLMLYKDPARVIDFDPTAETIPILYDFYDSYAKDFWEGKTDDFSKLFRLAHAPSDTAHLTKRFLPRFSEVAYLVQMPHLDLLKEVEKMAGRELTASDKAEAEERGRYAKLWLTTYAPEKYKFEIQKELPEVAKHFGEAERLALTRVCALLESNPSLDGQTLHTRLHELKTELGIKPHQFFGALYLSILGKESGPKAGWFLSVLQRDFLLKRLHEAAVEK